MGLYFLPLAVCLYTFLSRIYLTFMEIGKIYFIFRK